MTQALEQCSDWWSRSDREIARRIALIEKDGNVLHAFAPSSPPKRSFPMFVAYADRRKEALEIMHEDRRRSTYQSIKIKKDGSQ